MILAHLRGRVEARPGLRAPMSLARSRIRGALHQCREVRPIGGAMNVSGPSLPRGNFLVVKVHIPNLRKQIWTNHGQTKDTCSCSFR